MDARLSLPARIAAYLFVPIGLIALMPVVLLFVVAYYLFVSVQGVRAGIDIALGRPEEPDPTVRRPHFLDAPAQHKSRIGEP